MKNITFNRFYFSLILGLPLAIFASFLINLPNQTNFQKYYKNLAIYKFSEGFVNRFNKDVLQKKVLGNVHFGKNEKLFYLPKSDGNVFEDLYGKNKFYFDYVKQWERYLQKYENHPGYFFIVAPNKERILKDELDLLVDPNFNLGKRRYDVFPRTSSVLFPGSYLKNEDYYLSDTHWNLLGARKVLTEIFTHRGLPLSVLDGYSVTQFDRGGDIPRMVNNDFFIFYPAFNKELGLALKNQKTLVRTDINGENVIRFTNANAPLKIRVLVFGDSFRETLVELLSDVAIEVISAKYKEQAYLESVKLGYFDLVLDVRVERYLGSLTDYNIKL